MKKIKLYHMSETLKLGDELMPDYLNKSVNCEPYISAMEKGLDSIELLLKKKIEEQQEDWNDVVNGVWKAFLNTMITATMRWLTR